MVVDPHAQVVCDPLADALGEVVVDVRGERAERRNRHRDDRRDGGDPQTNAAWQQARCGGQPCRRLSHFDHVVEHDLERPRRRQAHRGFDGGGRQDQRDPEAVRPKERGDEVAHPLRAKSLVNRMRCVLLCQSGPAPCSPFPTWAG